jgi:hypothetical protein
MMPSTGSTLRQEAAAGIETARRYLKQAASYLREKRFQQHPIYQKLMPLFRFLIGAAYSNEARLYKRRLCEQFARLLLLLLVTIPINAALLYFYRSMWHLYQMTYVGQQYEGYFSEKALIISNLLSCNPIILSFDFTMAALVICMGIAVLCQVFHLSRYFYYSRDFWGKLLVWGSILTAAVAWHLDDVYVFHDFSMACFFALVPTLCLFDGCFDGANILVPEMGDVIRKVSSWRGGMIKGAGPCLNRITQWVEDGINRFL